MKKIIAYMLAFCMIASLVGCGNQSKSEDLRGKFPEYFDLPSGKGLEVYVWQTAEDTYYCGLLSGTNMIKSDAQIEALAENGASIEEMKEILSSYDISTDNIYRI